MEHDNLNQSKLTCSVFDKIGLIVNRIELN